MLWIRKFFSSAQEEVRTLLDLSSVNLPQCFAFQGFPSWSAAKTRKKLFPFVGHNFKMIAHPSIRKIISLRRKVRDLLATRIWIKDATDCLRIPYTRRRQLHPLRQRIANAALIQAKWLFVSYKN